MTDDQTAGGPAHGPADLAAERSADRSADGSADVAAGGSVDGSAGLAADVRRVAELSGRFVLRSGEVSETYFDKYRFEADPVLLRRVAEAMVPLVPDDTEVLAGLELGGIPVVTALSALTGLPARFVRKQAKEYGTAQQIEGGPVSGLRVTIVEDVVTSGGAVLDAAAALRAAGAVLDLVICAIDREQSGAANLTTVGLTLRAALTRTTLTA